jgi:hypothetical protein
MNTLQIEPNLPEITPAQSLAGWRREFCIELLGDAGARIFVRVEAIRPELQRLADTAQRTRPDKDNLFATVAYDRIAWERVQHGIDRWARRNAR